MLGDMQAVEEIHRRRVSSIGQASWGRTLKSLLFHPVLLGNLQDQSKAVFTIEVEVE